MKAKNYFIFIMITAICGTLLASIDNNSVALEKEHQRYHSQVNAYSIAIPESWKKVSDDVMKQTLNAVLTEEAKKTLTIDTIIAKEVLDKKIQYPYLVIQVMKYSDYFGTKQRLSKNQITYLLKVFTGQDIDPFNKNMVVEDMRSMITEISTNVVSFDKQNMVYKYRVESEIVILGKVKGFVVGHFGRFAVIQLMFYCLESDWSRYENERNLMFDTFHFDTGMQYEDAPEDDVTANESSILDRLGKAAGRGLAYALIAVVLGAIVGVFKLIGILSQPEKKSQE